MPTVEALDLIKTSIERATDEVRKTCEELRTAEGAERAKLKEELASLEKQVTGLTDAVKSIEERPNFSGIETTDKGEKEKFSWHRACQLVLGIASPKDKAYGYEMEVFQAGMESYDYQPAEMKTAVNAATDSGGGFLIPTEVMSEIIPELEAMEIASSLGVTIVNGATSNISYVKEEGVIAAYYVDSEAEESVTESVTTFSNIEARPHVVAAVVPLSRSMMTQPSVAMDSYIMRRIAKKIALREDKSVFVGTGSNAEPRGVLLDPGIDTGVDWTSPTVGTASDTTRGLLIDMIDAVEDNDANMNGRMAWAMSNKVKYALAKVNDADGKPLYVGMDAAAPATLLGRPVYTSTQLKNATTTEDRIIFGDWSEVVLTRWGTMALAASDTTETNFRKLRTSVRGVVSHDVSVLQPAVFASGQNFDLADF